MATSISTLLLVLLTIFLSVGGRAAPPAKAAEEKPKRPDCFIDGGIGRVSDIIPSYGDAGFGFQRQYIPGGDDLPVPNPGYEVPIGSAP